ncbi:hypothetical protein [Sphingobacterium corticibacterium]|uniref:Uncharacterized protein n=1 Tax=Sphingobacterium corticibacterium TaxID=2484746 RepID=A0A4Q6XDN0_9SPHI|nr:hypothetical protein [Sphingobacterium corticibacterium]RZF57890.1 hypothetical protein EWE74_19660 [Sphingobacterium corticibacterium]
MKKFIFKHIMPVLALALISGSYVLMSFGAAHTQQDELHWFEKDNDGVYQDMGISDAPPNSCDGFAGNVCAKGFSLENPIPDPEDITDSTPSEDTRRRP